MQYFAILVAGKWEYSLETWERKMPLGSTNPDPLQVKNLRISFPL